MSDDDDDNIIHLHCFLWMFVLANITESSHDVEKVNRAVESRANCPDGGDLLNIFFSHYVKKKRWNFFATFDCLGFPQVS